MSLYLAIMSWNSETRELILLINYNQYLYKVDAAVYHRFEHKYRNPKKWGKALSYLKNHATSVHKMNPSRKGRNHE